MYLTGWGEIICTIQQKQLLKIENYFPQCIDTPNLICAFKQQVLGLSKEVHNFSISTLRQIMIGPLGFSVFGLPT